MNFEAFVQSPVSGQVRVVSVISILTLIVNRVPNEFGRLNCVALSLKSNVSFVVCLAPTNLWLPRIVREGRGQYLVVP